MSWTYNKNWYAKKIDVVSHLTEDTEVLYKKVFLKISQNSPTHTTLLKKRSRHRCFPVNFPKFYRTPSGDCFCNYLSFDKKCFCKLLILLHVLDLHYRSLQVAFNHYPKTSDEILHTSTMASLISINQFHATVSFYTPLKTSENLWFPDVFRWYRKRPVA